jgi:hypothetical protein
VISVTFAKRVCSVSSVCGLKSTDEADFQRKNSESGFVNFLALMQDWENFCKIGNDNL